MKITNLNDQLVIKTSGVPQIIIGLFFVLMGSFFTFLTATLSDDTTGKKAPIYVPLVCAAFVILGIILIILAKSKTITLQRDGQSNILARKVIGGTTQIQNFQTADVAAVQLISGLDYSNTDSDNRQPQRKSTVSLLLKNNSIVELGSGSGGRGFSINGLNINNLIRKAPLSKEANEISAYLGVPLQSHDTSTLSGLTNIFQGQNNQPAPPVNSIAGPPMEPILPPTPNPQVAPQQPTDQTANTPPLPPSTDRPTP